MLSGLSVTGMVAFVSALLSWLAGRFRGRVELELEVIALRHQLAVLHRQRSGRPQLFALGRLLWIWLYRVWPQCLNVMVLVKPATAVRWHRQGFRLYWRWRAGSGRPSVDREVRDLIRQMNRANPLWGAPRIHGELLKLGIEVSQATVVAKYMVRRVGTPSPTWRSFLSNEAIGIAAVDTFVAVSVVSTALRHDHPGSRSQKDCAVRCYAASRELVRIRRRAVRNDDADRRPAGWPRLFRSCVAGWDEAPGNPR